MRLSTASKIVALFILLMASGIVRGHGANISFTEQPGQQLAVWPIDFDSGTHPLPASFNGQNPYRGFLPNLPLLGTALPTPNYMGVLTGYYAYDGALYYEVDITDAIGSLTRVYVQFGTYAQLGQFDN